MDIQRAMILTLKKEAGELRRKIMKEIRDFRSKCAHEHIREGQWKWYGAPLKMAPRKEHTKTVRICMNCGLTEEHRYEGEYFLILVAKPVAKIAEAQYSSFKAMEIPVITTV
ncbi:hypothetical protein HYW94_01185 [Candidatus Uhrbacteria bacterium]|nr:hypothetical protein [Candidatus Uhrbacteria bacterium]